VNTESNNDLEWMAFCYLTGDLTPDDAAAFEQRLGDDQTVREAVCRMAALRDKLVTASGRCDEPVLLRNVASASRFGRQKLRLRQVTAAAVWAACGAAAASLCFVLADFGRPTQIAKPPSEPGALATEPAPDPLAWAQLRPALRWPSELQLSPDPPVTTVLKPVIDSASDGLPSWLLATISEPPQED